MDFRNIKAEELLTAMPPTEDDRWETKSASLLEPKEKGDLKKELGKQVSAFANSGGGHIVIGVDDRTRGLEPCLETVGRQSMDDYLANLIEQSVEQPLQGFQVYRIEFKSDSTKAIYLIHVEDSPAAPHQAKDERQYYYRIDGHSKPAPHFYLELLRQRETNCVVEPSIKDVIANLPYIDREGHALECKVIVEVRNCASFLAQPVGLSIKTDLPENWKLAGMQESQNSDHVLSKEYLFPGLVATFELSISCKIGQDDPDRIEMVIAELPQAKLTLRAFSQNFGSESITVCIRDHVTDEELRSQHSDNVKRMEKLQASFKKTAEDVLPGIQAGMRHAMDKLSQSPKLPKRGDHGDA